MVSLVSEFPNDNPALHRGVRWVCLEVTGGCTAEIAVEPVAPPRIEPVAAPDQLGPATDDADRVVEVSDQHVEHEEVAASGAATEAVVDPEPIAELGEEIAEEAPAVLESGVVLSAHVEAEDDDEIIVEELEPLGEIEPEAPLVMVATETLPPPSDVEDTPTTVLPPAPDDPFTLLVCRLADIAIGAGAPDVAAMLPALLMDGRLTNDVAPETAAALKEAGIVVDGAVTATFAGQMAAWRAILRGTSDDFDATGGAMLDEWAAELLACLLGAPSRGASLRKDLRARGVAAFGLVAAA